ncbi:MAG: hypothetical protein ABR555_16605 [Pyrinomonadaceae bacterium]
MRKRWRSERVLQRNNLDARRVGRSVICGDRILPSAVSNVDSSFVTAGVSQRSDPTVAE